MIWKSLAFALPLSLCLGIQVPLAEPSVEIDDEATISEGIDGKVERELKKASGLKKFVLQECGDADLAKLCALFPDMEDLQVNDGENIRNLAPLAGLKKLRTLGLSDCAATDLSPVAGLTGLTTLHVQAAMRDLAWMEKLVNLTMVTVGSENLTSLKGLPRLPGLTRIVISGGAPNDLTPIVEALPSLENLALRDMTLPDLTPLTKLSMLEDLDLYGSKLKDFSPLAGCPRLVKLNYYGTEGADYATLGKLSQVRELEGGLSKLKDIAWIAHLPNLKSFFMFSEAVQDFSPLAKTHLESLKLWKMSRGAPVDLAHVAGIAGLRELEIHDMEVTRFEALSACTSLQKVTVTDVQGAGDLAALKKLPALKLVVVDEDMPEAALKGFAPGVKVTRD